MKDPTGFIGANPEERVNHFYYSGTTASGVTGMGESRIGRDDVSIVVFLFLTLRLVDGEIY